MFCLLPLKIQGQFNNTILVFFETEYATLRRLAVEAEPTLNESLVENGKVGGGQLRDLTTAELSRYKSNRVELIFVPAAG